MKPWFLASAILISAAIPSQAESLGDCSFLPFASSSAEIEIRNHPDGSIMLTSNSGNRSGPKGTIADYDEAIRRNPDDARAYLNRGNAYCEKGDYDQAIADFNRAIERAPDDPDAYVALTSAHWRRREVDLAIAAYDEAVKLNPVDRRLYT